MNDEELGRALGTALAAPDLTAAPDAGPRLRIRARRERTGRLAVGGTVVLVLAVLLTVGLVRGIGGSPTAPVAAPATGFRMLTTPMTVNAFGPAPSPGPCTAGAEQECGPAALIVDQVDGLSTTYLLERGAVVMVSLTATDAATLRAALAPGPGDSVSVTVGQGSYQGLVVGDGLRIPMPSAQDADAFVAELGPVPLAAPRTGPGRLDRQLQLWTVADTAASPCRLRAARPGVLVVNTPDACLVLHGPALSLGSADLQVLPPDAGNQVVWRVQVGVDPADRAALAAFTRAQTGNQVAFVAGGRLLPGVGTPVIQGEFSTGIELTAADRVGAYALVTRLRS